MISQWAADIDWQKIAFDPVFLFLTGWFASGFLVAMLPQHWRLGSFVFVGILLQGVLRGTSLPAFELTNILVYVYALAVRHAVNRNISVKEGESEICSSSPTQEAWRWKLCCWGMVALIVAAIVVRDFLSEQQTSIELGHVRWAVVYLDFIQLLRLITFLHEYGSGFEVLPSVKHYALWINLPVGVIIRPSEFLPQLEKISFSPSWAEVFHWRQILLLGAGAMKWLLGLALVSIGAMSFDSEYAWSKKWVAIFLVGPWSFYLISAGSFDVQCFVARTWNLSLPMAWNAPFFRTNLSAFWANWNMTMTSLYRDYLFFNRWGLAKANIYLNAMIVFVAMGVWHALNWYWFIFGIYHGLGFCAYLWFQQAKKKYAFGMWISWWPVALVCWLFTYVFVCLGWLIPSKIVEYLGLAEGVTYD